MTVELLPPEAIDLAFANAAQILDARGVDLVDDPQSLAALAAAGVRIDGNAVKGPLPLLAEIASSAPATFVQHARDSARSVHVGGGRPIFVPVYGPPNVRGDDGRRRTATLADYESLLAIADGSPALGNTGHMLCVPDDVAVASRDAAMADAHLRLSGKPFFGATTSEASALETIELVRRAFSYGDEDDCRLLHLCSPIPPLRYTSRMLGVLRASATSGQGSVITSFQMLGATGPAAVLGAISQGIAEVIVGIALSQLYREGAPVVLGIYGIPFDMRTILPRFGDPVSALTQSGACQVARRLGLPALGYGGLTSSKIDDFQAGSEAAHATRIAVDTGADVVLHAAGWLENGRTTGFAKFRREAAALEASAAANRLET